MNPKAIRWMATSLKRDVLDVARKSSYAHKKNIYFALRDMILTVESMSKEIEVMCIEERGPEPSRTSTIGTAGRIIKEVALEYGFSPEVLRSAGRQRDIFHARAEAMRRIRQTGRYSLSQIGRFFGRDHSTVKHSLEIAEWLEKRRQARAVAESRQKAAA